MASLNIRAATIYGLEKLSATMAQKNNYQPQKIGSHNGLEIEQPQWLRTIRKNGTLNAQS